MVCLMFKTRNFTIKSLAIVKTKINIISDVYVSVYIPKASVSR